MFVRWNNDNKQSVIIYFIYIVTSFLFYTLDFDIILQNSRDYRNSYFKPPSSLLSLLNYVTLPSITIKVSKINLRIGISQESHIRNRRYVPKTFDYVKKSEKKRKTENVLLDFSCNKIY